MKITASGLHCLELQYLRRDVGAVGVVGNLRRDLDVRGLGSLEDGGSDRSAVVGVLVHDRDRVDLASRLLQVVEELRVGVGEVRRDRSGAECPFEATLRDVERDEIGDEERNALALGGRGCDERHRGVIGAEHGRHFVLRDQA